MLEGGSTGVNVPEALEFERRFFKAAAIWLQVQIVIQEQDAAAFGGSSFDPFLSTLGDCDWRTELAIEIRDERRSRGERRSLIIKA